MNNVYDYRRSFNSLLESTLGNVKPLISEATEPPIGDEPPVGDEPGEGKVEITPEQKEELKQEISNQLHNLPAQTKIDLGIGDHTGKEKESALEYVISHSTISFDPSAKKAKVELGGFGPDHSIKPVINFKFDSQDSAYKKTSLSSNLRPPEYVNIGFKMNLNTFLGKGT